MSKTSGTKEEARQRALLRLVQAIGLPTTDVSGPVLCRDAEEDVWFPQQGGRGPEQARIARAACRRCPIREQCLERAMAFEGSKGREERYGIWGGTTAPERAQLAKERRLARAGH